MSKYQYKTDPFDHQIECLRLSWDKTAYAFLMEMGTGKSKVTIDNAAVLYEYQQINALFILAPKGAYRNWIKQVAIHLPDRIQRVITYWTPSPNGNERKAMTKVLDEEKKLAIFVMNIEALATAKGRQFAERFVRRHQTMMVVDESTTIKNPKAKRTKACIELGQHARFRRILTGTPVTASPLDLYSQCQFLDPKLLGFKSYYAFRGHYAITKSMNTGPKTFKIVVGYRNLEELSERLKRFSYRKRKDECLDLPPKIYERRTVQMTEEQARIYKEMREYAITEFDEGESTVDSVITLLLRLHQIACGYLPRDDGEIEVIPNRRMDALLELLEECGQKVIIWATYRYSVEEIVRVIAKKYGKESVAHYYGGTPANERPRINENFQDMNHPLRFLVCNQAGAYGIHLYASHDVVYYTNSYDYDVRGQSEDRAHRIGQTMKVVYTDIVTEGTVDERILTCLENKQKIATEILDRGSIADFI